MKIENIDAIAEHFKAIGMACISLAEAITEKTPEETDTQPSKEKSEDSLNDYQLIYPTEIDNTPVKFEELRARLATLLRNGHKNEVKKLFEKYGASKLSEVKESDWTAVFNEAGEINAD